MQKIGGKSLHWIPKNLTLFQKNFAPPAMMVETNILIQLLTGGQSEHVTVVCDNGEIRINTALLVSLYTIFGNLVRGLIESNVILFKGMKKEDLVLLFQRLMQQGVDISIKEEMIAAILSMLVTNELDSEPGMVSYTSEADQENQDPDFVMGFPTEDDDNPQKETPIVIKIKKPTRFRGKYYKCHICEKEIPQKAGPGSLNKVRSEHLSSVHGFQLETCHVCGIECVEIEKHLKNKHQKCPYCEKFCEKRKFEQHLRYHQRLEDKAAKKEDKEKPKEKTKCPHCNNLYSEIAVHIKERCPKIEYEKEVCKECGTVCDNRMKLRAHIDRFHKVKKKREFMCNICGKVLSSPNALSVHHRSFHEIRELIHKCEKCGKLFGDQSLLESHLRKVHIEKTPCSICGLKVRQIKEHMGAVHTKDEDKKHQCQDCGKGFMLKRKLEIHRINMHLKTKPHSCRYGCDISYNDDSNRNAHEKKTHGKLFTTAREEKLKEKIEFLGLDEKSFTTGIM